MKAPLPDAPVAGIRMECFPLRTPDSQTPAFSLGFPARNYCYRPVSLVSHPGIQADMTLTRRSNCGQPEMAATIRLVSSCMVATSRLSNLYGINEA